MKGSPSFIPLSVFETWESPSVLLCFRHYDDQLQRDCKGMHGR